MNNRSKKDLDYYNNNIKYRGIKNIRYLFNEKDIYNGINDIKYLFNENEDKITHNSNIKDKESLFKSTIEDIKRGLYYVEKMNNETSIKNEHLSTSDLKIRFSSQKN